MASSASSGTEHLTIEQLKGLAQQAQDDITKDSFEWFANHVRLFTFQTQDNLTLQGYHFALPLKGKSSKRKRGSDKPVFLHCAGYAESTVKYAHYLKHIYEQGYEIFSFDLRHQGFSHNYPVLSIVSSTSPSNKNNDLGTEVNTITHASSFRDTYVSDLYTFIEQFIHPVTHRIIYSANSMSGLIGLLLQSEKPLFEKMVLATPGLMPHVATPLHYLLYLLTNVGLGTATAARFETDMAKEKLTHCPRKLEAWILLRDTFPRQFYVTGCTFGFIYEFVKAGYQALSAAPSITIPVLILQASDDAFVDNKWTNMYFGAAVNSPSMKLVRLRHTYHEILTEIDQVVDHVLAEIQLFLDAK